MAYREIFKAGFDGTVNAGTILSPELNASRQMITGADGDTWPVDFQGNNQTTSNFIHIVVGGSPTDLDSYFLTETSTQTDRFGVSKKVLKQQLTADPAGGLGQSWYQIVWTVDGVPMVEPGVRVTYWMYLPSGTVTSMGNSNWRSTYFMKSVATNFRIEAYIYTDASGDAYWHVHGDEGSQTPIYWQNTRDDTIPVTEGAWVKHEHIYDRKNTYYRWKIDNQVVLEQTSGNFSGTDANAAIYQIAPFGLYGTPSSYPWYQYIDDFQLDQYYAVDRKTASTRTAR